MSGWKPKRFWKSAQVVAEGDAFTVTLDGRPIRTPGKAPLLMPSRAMAVAVAAEWDDQGATVAVDATHREDVASALVVHAEDLFVVLQAELALFRDQQRRHVGIGQLVEGLLEHAAHIDHRIDVLVGSCMAAHR